jgi:hypothetical protein
VGGRSVRTLAEMAAGICEACRREMEDVIVAEYPVKQIMHEYEKSSKDKPISLGNYKYKGKIYGIEITVKEYEK